ncbi:MAG: membrane associated rhomboid family serine protease [Saprospiraceae bacterium]|jgi:membrane associated rhomboid family serine protease
MFIPIGDTQVKGGYFPFVCYAFIIINVLAFLYQLTDPNIFVCDFGAIPNDIVRGDGYITLITSTFMHGSWMHLIGNMVFLWVFGDNIEATVGNFSFAGFYILGALAASGLHILLSNSTGVDLAACCNLCSGCPEGVNICLGSIPTVGASGAISAILGAYLVMFPKSKVKTLIFYFFLEIPAFLFLGIWIGQQLFFGFGSLGPEASASGGTAWWAHIGGFAFGIIAGYFARKLKPKGEIRFRAKNDFL